MSNKKKIENKAIEEAVRAFAEGHTTQVNEQEAEEKIFDQKQEITKLEDIKYSVPNKNTVESKTKKVQLLLKPSVHEKLRKIADAEKAPGKDKGSVNDLINRVLEGFTDEYYRKGEEE